MSNNVVLAIDVQIDFCDPSGALFVPGAVEDTQRSAEFITRNGDKLSKIYVTLDQHHVMDIAHPMWWTDGNGKSPNPFTVITSAEVESGKWSCRNYRVQDRSLEYLKALESSGKYPHVIWPEHCLIGSRGSNVDPVFYDAINSWSRKHKSTIAFVTKGSNPYTEHFSAIQAEVPDPHDPATQVNYPLVESIESADNVYIMGQALSHCVANTVRDIANNFKNKSLVSKMVLLRDCSSPVPTFESYADQFINELTALGMRVTDSGSVTL
jgi:nicotinamidase/pyrazinamidase